VSGNAVISSAKETLLTGWQLPAGWQLTFGWQRIYHQQFSFVRSEEVRTKRQSHYFSAISA